MFHIIDDLAAINGGGEFEKVYHAICPLEIAETWKQIRYWGIFFRSEHENFKWKIFIKPLLIRDLHLQFPS